MYHSHITRVIFLSLSLAIGLNISTPAAAETGAASPTVEPGIGAKVLDAMLLRPLGALSTIAGAGFFIVCLPLAAPAGQYQNSKEVLLDTPFDDTFRRPLGAI